MSSAPASSASRSSPCDDQRMPAEALEQLRQLLVAHRLVDRRVGDLVAVEVQDRQHRAAGRRVEELVQCQAPAVGPVSASPSPTMQATIRSGLSSAAPNAGGQRVAELAALVDRARHDRGDVAREAPGPGEVADQLREPRAVAGQLGVDVLEAAVDPQVREVGGRAVAGTGHQQDARLGLEDQPVEPGVDQVDAGHRAPVAEQAVLDVLGLRAAPRAGGCPGGRSSPPRCSWLASR